MADKSLDDFLSAQTAPAMKIIEDRIHAEVTAKICKYFGINAIDELSEDQITEVKKAQDSREKGFIKLGYNLVLQRLRKKS